MKSTLIIVVGNARRHEAERLEQEARGKLERQKITDQAEAERARKELLELEALRCLPLPLAVTPFPPPVRGLIFYFTFCPSALCASAAVESTGAAKAEAQSRAEAARIQGEAAVHEAKLKVEAQCIEAVRHLPVAVVTRSRTCVTLVHTHFHAKHDNFDMLGPFGVNFQVDPQMHSNLYRSVQVDLVSTFECLSSFCTPRTRSR